MQYEILMIILLINKLDVQKSFVQSSVQTISY